MIIINLMHVDSIRTLKYWKHSLHLLVFTSVCTFGLEILYTISSVEYGCGQTWIHELLLLLKRFRLTLPPKYSLLAVCQCAIREIFSGLMS